MAFRSRHTPEMRKAVEAMLRDTDLSMLAISARTTVSYATVRLWNQLARIRPPAREARRGDAPAMPPVRPASPPDLAGLDAMLGAYIAEQIAASAEKLRAEGAAADTARVLRDLGGLNRLLDDIAGRARQRQRDGDADGEPETDLDALRERIARRVEAHLGHRRDAAAAEDPGAGPPRGPGH